jgi:ribonuclease PH
MTGGGKLIEIQGTAEQAPFSLNELDRLVALAKHGIGELVRLQRNLVKDLA